MLYIVYSVYFTIYSLISLTNFIPVSATAVKKDKFLDFRNFLKKFKKQKRRLRETLSNKLYLFTAVFQGVNHLNIIYYISTLNSVIEGMAGHNSKDGNCVNCLLNNVFFHFRLNNSYPYLFLVSWHTSLFSYIQYGNIVFGLFIGWLIEKAHKSKNKFSFSLMTLICIICASTIVIIVTIKVLELQVVGYLAFLIARVLTYSLPPVIYLKW